MTSPIDAALSALQSTVDALRAELGAPQARKYTSVNGVLELNTKTGCFSISSPTGKATSSDLEKAEHSTICIDPGQAVQPLRMGKVMFYGESARQIRAAQGVLQDAGVGQLELVKRANEPGEPFVEIDGQVFINKATVSQATVSADRFELRGAGGKVHASEFGLGVSSPFETALSQGVDAALEYLAAQIAETKLVITAAKGCAEAADAALHDRIERVVGECLRRELRPGGMLHRG